MQPEYIRRHFLSNSLVKQVGDALFLKGTRDGEGERPYYTQHIHCTAL